MVAHELNCILINDDIKNTSFAVFEAYSRKVVTYFELFFP
jgi:hypothetical protein